MPRSFFFGKLVDGGSIDEAIETTMLKKPNRQETGRDFLRSQLVGGGYFSGQSQEEFIAFVTLGVDSGVLNFSGEDLDLNRHALDIDPGVLSFVGQALDLAIPIALVVDPGIVIFTGQDISLGLRTILTIESASITYTGQDLNLAIPADLSIEAGSIIFTGQDIALNPPLDLTIESGSITFVGDDVRFAVFDRTITLGSPDGVNTGYGGTAGWGSVSDDLVYGEQIRRMFDTNSPTATKQFLIEIHDATVSDSLFTSIEVDSPDRGVTELFSADATIQTFTTGGNDFKRWTWTDTNSDRIFPSSAIGETIDWTIS